MLEPCRRKAISNFIIKMLTDKGALPEKEILTKVYITFNDLAPASVFITLKARNKIRFKDKKWELKK